MCSSSSPTASTMPRGTFIFAGMTSPDGSARSSRTRNSRTRRRPLKMLTCPLPRAARASGKPSSVAIQRRREFECDASGGRLALLSCALAVVTPIERQVDAPALFERLEVAELIDTPEAVLQRVGIKDRALQKAHIPPDDAVVRRRVADERDAVDEILPAFLQPHCHVDDGRQ